MNPKTPRFVPYALLLILGLLLASLSHHSKAQAEQKRPDPKIEFADLSAMADFHTAAEGDKLRKYLHDYFDIGGPRDATIENLVKLYRREVRQNFIDRWGGQWSQWGKKPAIWNSKTKKWEGWPEDQRNPNSPASRHVKDLLNEAAQAMGHPSLEAMNLGVDFEFDATLSGTTFGQFKPDDPTHSDSKNLLARFNLRRLGLNKPRKTTRIGAIKIGPHLLQTRSRAEQLQTAVHEILHAKMYSELVGRLRARYEKDTEQFEHDRAKYTKDNPNVHWDAADPIGDLARREAYRLRGIEEKKDIKRDEDPTKPLSKPIEKIARYWREERIVERDALLFVDAYLRKRWKLESQTLLEATNTNMAKTNKRRKEIQNLRRWIRKGATYEPMALDAIHEFRGLVGALRSDLGAKMADAPRVERFKATMERKPIFGGIVFGNGADPRSVRLLQAKIAIKDGEPYFDLLVDGPAGRQQCRYEPMSATELWAAYHVVRPTKAMREMCGLDGRDSGLLGCKIDPMGVEARFGIHPALASNYVGFMAQRLDLLVAAGAPGLFDEIDYTRYAMQWYDESALLRVEDGQLVVEAAKGPPHVLLRARFWGHDQDPNWLTTPLQLNIGTLAPGLSDEWLDPNSRQERIGLEVYRRMWERLAYGPTEGKDAAEHVTRERYLAEKARAAAEVMQEMAGNLPLDSGPIIADAFGTDPSLYMMNHFAQTLAVLNWIADSPDVAFPELPAEVNQVELKLNPRMSIVELIQDLRAAAPRPPISWMEAEPVEEVKCDREWWYAVYYGGIKRGYRHDTLRTTDLQGKTGILFERHDLVAFPQQEGIAVCKWNLSALHPFRWKMWPEQMKYEAFVGTEEPYRREGRVDEKDSRKFIVTETTGDETTTKQVDRPLESFLEEQLVRTLIETPLKPGEEKWLNSLHRLRAIGTETTEVLGEQRTLLRVAWTMFNEANDQQENTLWVDPEGVIVKQLMRGRRPMIYYLTSREVARGMPPDEPLEFPRSVPVVKADRKLENPESIKSLRLRVHLKGASSTKPFVTSLNQTVTQIDPKTFEIEVRRPRPEDIPPPPPEGGPVPSTIPTEEEEPKSPARRRAEMAKLKAQMQRLDQLLRDGGGRLPPDFNQSLEKEFDEYLQPNDFIQSDHPVIKMIAGISLPRSQDDLLTAVDLEWMVFGMLGKSYKHPYLSAVETVLAKEGDCSEHAALLVALTRARGIPSRLASGFRYVPELEAFVAHQWAEVKVNNVWWPLDATLGQGQIGATHIKTDDSPGLYPEDDGPNLNALVESGVARIEVIAVERATAEATPKPVDAAFPPSRQIGPALAPSLGPLPPVAPSAPQVNRRAEAFDLGVSIAQWASLQDMHGRFHQAVGMVWERTEAAARNLEMSVPPPGPSQHLTDLAVLNLINYLSRRAEPKLSTALRDRHGKEIEASFLFPTRACTLVIIHALLPEKERLLRCEELERLARTSGIAEKFWKPFTDAVRKPASLAEIQQQYQVMLPAVRNALEGEPPTTGKGIPPSVVVPESPAVPPPPAPLDSITPAAPMGQDTDGTNKAIAEARQVLERLKGKTADTLTTEELQQLIAAKKVLEQHNSKLAGARALIDRFKGKPVDSLTQAELEAYLAAKKLLAEGADPKAPGPMPPIPGTPGPGPFPPIPTPGSPFPGPTPPGYPGFPSPGPTPPMPKVEPPAAPKGPEVRTEDATDMLGVWAVKDVLRGVNPGKLDLVEPTVLVLKDHLVTLTAGGDVGRIIPIKLGKSTADYSEVEVGEPATVPGRLRMYPGILRASSHRLHFAFVRGGTINTREALARHLDSQKPENDVLIWQLERRDKAEVKAGPRDVKKIIPYADLAKAFADLVTIQGTWESVDPQRPVRLIFDRAEIKIQDARFKTARTLQAGSFALNPMTDPGTLALILNRSNQTIRYQFDKDHLVLFFGYVRQDERPQFPGAPEIGPGPGFPPGGIGNPMGPPGSGIPGGIGSPPGVPMGGPAFPNPDDPGVPGVGPPMGPGDPMGMPPAQAAETIAFKRVVPKK